MRLSFAGSTGCVRLDVVVALAVAVRVEDQRRPPLRLLLVAGLVEQLRVQPAHHRPAAARPQRVVRVLGEHEMVRAEAGADVRELLRLRVVHREVAARARASGNSFADGCAEPALQTSGLSGGRTVDVIHTRPRSSSIGLCTLFLLVQIGSSPQYGDALRSSAAAFATGVFGSRTVSGTLLDSLRAGSSTGR